MDYKEVLEDQIKELQQLQKENMAENSFGKLSEKVKMATDITEQIRKTVEDARNIELNQALLALRGAVRSQHPKGWLKRLLGC